MFRLNQQARGPARVADIVEFFDERFGVRVPELVTIHVASDEDSARGERWAEPLDSEFVGLAQRYYAEGSMFVHATGGDGRDRAISTFEGFEDHMAGGRDLGPGSG